MINPLTALIVYCFIIVLTAFGFGFAVGYLWRKEDEKLWTEDDIHDMMNNTD